MKDPASTALPLSALKCGKFSASHILVSYSESTLMAAGSFSFSLILY